jgi:hypothetical protein
MRVHRFLTITSTLLVSFLASGARAECNGHNYPCVSESIRCLIVDEVTGKPLTEKYVAIKKLFMAANDFSYSAEAAIHSPIDYSIDVTPLKPGLFHGENEIAKVTIQVAADTIGNFENPSNLEPFFVEYKYDSDLFEQHDVLKAKCLHQIF